MPASPIPGLQPIRGHMTLDPGGIEMFAAILHLVYAHTESPSRVGDAEHYKQATDYIRSFQRTAAVDRVEADAAKVVYIVGFANRPPVTVRIWIGRPAASALEVSITNGTFIPVDLTGFDVKCRR